MRDANADMTMLPHADRATKLSGVDVSGMFVRNISLVGRLPTRSSMKPNHRTSDKTVEYVVTEQYSVVSYLLV